MSSEQLSETGHQSSDLSPQKEQETLTSEEEMESHKTPSPLRGTPPSQGESLGVGPREEKSQVSSSSSQVPSKTQGIRPPRNDGAQALQDAAKKAAQSNSRCDVHEYMRLRRNYV